MTIRTMTLAELQQTLDWAAQEGWNPGLDDAQAFYAADPGGFFVAVQNDAPVAAISVVNHDAEQAFLGLYLCLPAFRGRGIAYALWQAALRHAGNRSVALDGVPDQQANYVRSGFVKTGRTIRFESPGIQPEAGPEMRRATTAHLEQILDMDRRAVGYNRDRYMRAWLTPTDSRQTLISADGAYATYRLCRSGLKIGPLYAQTDQQAKALLAACPFGAETTPRFIDVPEGSRLLPVVDALGWTPVFETARMVKGTAPHTAPPAFHSVTSLELG